MTFNIDKKLSSLKYLDIKWVETSKVINYLAIIVRRNYLVLGLKISKIFNQIRNLYL